MKRSLATARRVLRPLIGAAMFLAALVVIRGELVPYSLAAVRAAVADQSATLVLLALLLTALDYVALLGYDLLGLRYAGHQLPLRRVALASTTGFAFSQALGYPLLTGAPIRYRLYTGWGMDGLDVAKVVAFCGVTFWLGFLAFGGTVLFLSPLELPGHVDLPFHSTRGAGVGLALLAVAYVAWCHWMRRPLRVRGVAFSLPSGRVAALQIAVGSADWLASASVLSALLPSTAGLGFGETLSLYAVARVAGLLSRVPGGIGVFEAVILWYLPLAGSDPEALGALLAYRVIFYLLPLLAGAVLLAVSELRANRPAAEELVEVSLRTVSSVAPGVIAALTFVTGAILVLGGALPFSAGPPAWLTRYMPLPFFELADFTASLVGAALLILARGLQRRLDGAYHLTVVAVALGVLSAVARGPAIPEVVPVVVLLGVLVASRREFYRKASLVSESFTLGWVIAIALVVVTAGWLGFFAYARVEYSSDLWWTFTFGGDASRFLRSTVGAVTLLGLFSAARLIRPAPVVHTDADQVMLDRITPIVAASPRANARLALVGDKQILLSESGRAFLMYGVEGDSWISMGDPVGDPSEFRALVWRFRELADRAGDKPVFYQVTADYLPIYIELGLTLLKIGEEGFVDLTDFTFDGPRRADLRKATRRLEEVGATFEVVHPPEVPALMPHLESISEAWLAKWKTAEKGFSMGAFHRDYLLRNPVGVVRVDSVPVAFGNIWTGANEELSFDLIRYHPDAPKSTMDYMFAELIRWGREAGYHRMGLGMAPLSGMNVDPLSPVWDRVGTAVFRYGGHFYNFQGLRDYKDKFDPTWEPRYLASPAGFGLLGTLADVLSLIAGGVKGIVLR